MLAAICRKLKRKHEIEEVQETEAEEQAETGFWSIIRVPTEPAEQEAGEDRLETPSLTRSSLKRASRASWSEKGRS